jgi:hypothetical protein
MDPALIKGITKLIIVAIPHVYLAIDFDHGDIYRQLVDGRGGAPVRRRNPRRPRNYACNLYILDELSINLDLSILFQ